MIVEYEYEIIDPENLMESRTAVPKFITNGGYFQEGEHPNRTFVGIAPNDTVLPENARVMDRDALIKKMTDIGWKNKESELPLTRGIPGTNGRGIPGTPEEIEVGADWFINAYDS